MTRLTTRARLTLEPAVFCLPRMYRCARDFCARVFFSDVCKYVELSKADSMISRTTFQLLFVSSPCRFVSVSCVPVDRLVLVGLCLLVG
jgi:hypothetical protein